MILLEICFVKLRMDVPGEAAMKLLVKPRSEIACEIDSEMAVKFCSVVFQRKMSIREITLAISPAASLRGSTSNFAAISPAISLSISPQKI